MQVLTAAEMRHADTRAIQEIGIPGRVLMESAARAVAGAMEEHLDDLASRAIVILCGKGNNGGDGLALLRTLDGLGYDVRAIILAPLDELAPDALHNLQSSLKLGHVMDWVQTEEEWREIEPHWAQAGVIVDAILGTGLSSAARGLPAFVIDQVNALNAFRVAIDLPSGLSADTGAMLGTAFEANLTVALQSPKVCHYVSPACDHCGTVEVADIGIPPALLDAHGPTLSILEPDASAGSWPDRPASSHKGDFGHLLVVAGSMGRTGAAVLAAQAALRAGAGLVSVAAPASVVPIMAAQAPEIMWEPLPETESGSLSEDALERLLTLAAERSALAIGPGIGVGSETLAVTRHLLESCSVPTVVDADALRAFSGADALRFSASEDASKLEGERIALTPHPGEAARLLETTAAEIQKDRLGAVRRIAATCGAHVVLKGHRSLVCDPAGNVRINLTGNPGLATAGSGDVLTGAVGALLAAGAGVGAALELAVMAHGLAGDIAAAELGQTSMVATDVIAALPKAIASTSIS